MEEGDCSVRGLGVKRAPGSGHLEVEVRTFRGVEPVGLGKLCRFRGLRDREPTDQVIWQRLHNQSGAEVTLEIR